MSFSVLLALGLAATMIATSVFIIFYHDTKHEEIEQRVDYSFSGETFRRALGYYRFSGLAQGGYRVVIPATMKAPGAPLAGMPSTDPTEPDPNTDIDRDDNGIVLPNPTTLSMALCMPEAASAFRSKNIAVAAAPAAAAPILMRSQTSTARSFRRDIASPKPPAPETRRVNW